ncbi:SRPBCC family protein [Luteipulveratus flavus]|uniref:SRPBCC domain-containing protein n=1 Tax=Luteipulveratus flavus TaxID=3031728 RepID=A0ABT6CAC8_9MICO|nr:SRPBCC domain-containing protein [Luteipulveratus sp. YIM 133296]MDF8265846.1 SRPBCC domain-containing protein [Luteipulveratus sp. YIM 133296]
MTEELRLSRTYPVDADRLWAAWTVPDRLVRWWWRHWPGTTCTIDLRVGGRWRIDAPQQGIAVHGEYVTLEEPSLLAFTWIWREDGTDGPVEHVEVRFTPTPEGTLLDLHHTGIADAAGVADYRQGWTFVLDQLADTTSATPATG